MFKYVGCHVLGIIVGMGSVLITYPSVSAVAHTFAHGTVEKVVKPIGGNLDHPLAGTFEHESKRTE